MNTVKWVSLFAQLLPILIGTVERVGAHLAGHEKKAAVEDALSGIAGGVGVVMPEHAEPAQTAAAVANSSIDGVVLVLNQAGVLNPHKSADPGADPQPAAKVIPAAAAAVPAEVSHLAPQ